jgi:hypothetical protein
VPGTLGARGQVVEGRERGKNVGYTRRRKQQKGGSDAADKWKKFRIHFL